MYANHMIFTRSILIGDFGIPIRLCSFSFSVKSAGKISLKKNVELDVSLKCISNRVKITNRIKVFIFLLIDSKLKLETL